MFLSFPWFGDKYFFFFFFFFFNDTATTEIYTLSLHDALPIGPRGRHGPGHPGPRLRRRGSVQGPGSTGTPGRGRHRDPLGPRRLLRPGPSGEASTVHPGAGERRQTGTGHPARALGLDP